MSTIKLASWNVNGIRAASGKEGWKWFEEAPFDVIGLQELKAAEDKIPAGLRVKEGFSAFFNPCVGKAGFSGTAVYSRIEPVSFSLELPDPEYQGEGRLIHLEYPKFHFFTGYFPNGGAEILNEQGRPTGEFKRVPYKMGFFDCFFEYAEKLRKEKPIVVCGDFNIAHKPIDLANPKQNERNTGFLPVERAFLDKFTEAGYIDTFRLIHGDVPDMYSWWSYRARSREHNVGWRIDYFFVSEELRGNVADATIETAVTGSDHCPVTLTLNF